MGKVLGIHISESKHGLRKSVEVIVSKENWGLEGDFYAGNKEKNISLLSSETYKMVNKSCVLTPELGSFKENITTEGIDLSKLAVGTKIRMGETLNEVSKIGKTCYKFCDIYKTTGICQIPFETVFLRVIKGGIVKINDVIEVIEF